MIYLGNWHFKCSSLLLNATSKLLVQVEPIQIHHLGPYGYKVMYEALLCIHNVSDSEQSLQINLGALPLLHAGQMYDLITRAAFPVDVSGQLTLRVAPYQVLWLTGGRVSHIQPL